MKDDFFKFPSTPHLASIPGVEIRDDKVLTATERDTLLAQELIIEEKVDGANLGISFDTQGTLCLQNRGAFLPLPASGQWKKLDEWLSLHLDPLFEHLTDRYILFGEWCYARHSILYDRLPDWFLAFDIYDKTENAFLSVLRRDDLVKKMHLAHVPHLATGFFSYLELKKRLAQSQLTNQPAEGLYLRADHGDWLALRAKMVRSDFIQSVEQHWSRSAIKPNRLQQIPRQEGGLQPGY